VLVSWIGGGKRLFTTERALARKVVLKKTAMPRQIFIRGRMNATSLLKFKINFYLD